MPNPIRGMQVSALTPLQAPVSKTVLIEVLQQLIQVIDVDNRPVVELPEDAFERELLLSQRREFLTWVMEYPDVNIPMALYPLDTRTELLMPVGTLLC